MKKRDAVLFSMPLAAGVLTVFFALFIYWQNLGFERTYVEEARANISQEARLVVDIIKPVIESGQLEKAVGFCHSFQGESLRLSLITEDGSVLADSMGNVAFLANHKDRPEVKAAFSGIPASDFRYSESLGLWMMYYAIPFSARDEKYVLRVSVPNDRMNNIIGYAKLNMFWALLFGAEIILILSLYIYRRVRRPLIVLQQSVGEIANGNLGTRIDIPTASVVRELAEGVSEMTEQLKTRLAEVTSERNEKNTILESMSEGVLLFSADGNLLRHNIAAATLFEFAANDKFNIGRCQIPELLTLAHKTLSTGKPFEREFTLRRSGVERSLFVKGRTLSSPTGKQLLLTVTELTSLHKLESFRSDFVANVSHEIKTPLTCIVGAVEALEDYEELPKEHRIKLLDILKAQSSRLNSLVHDILSLATLEKQQIDMSFTLAPCALDAAVMNAVKLCSPRAAQKDIVLALTESDHVTVEGDFALLEQTVVNLIENAMKYSGSSRIEASLRKLGTNAIVEVRDYGIGIAPEHHKRIFERFYRVDKSRSRELGGTGLGLAIVKHTAQLHRGKVELVSTPGKGSTFRIIIPLS